MELPNELLFTILLDLPYQTLLSYCLTHKGGDRVWRTDYFWKLKVDQDFHGLSVYKPDNLTYHQQYLDLLKSPDPNEVAGLGRLDLLIGLEYQGDSPEQYGVNRAAMNGHLKILDWLDRRGLHPDQHGANLTGMHGQLEVLQWMEQRGYPLPDQNGINQIAANGHFRVLEWLYQQRSLLPDEVGMGLAASNGHLNVVEWIRGKA